VFESTGRTSHSLYHTLIFELHDRVDSRGHVNFAKDQVMKIGAGSMSLRPLPGNCVHVILRAAELSKAIARTYRKRRNPIIA